MKLSKGLRREKTNVASTASATFNAPTVYVPPYGKTVVRIGGRGASGNSTTGGTCAGTNPTTGGNYAGTNPTTGGNYAGTNPSTGGNYAGTNPATGGNYAGTNPGNPNWSEAICSWISPWTATPNTTPSGTFKCNQPYSFSGVSPTGNQVSWSGTVCQTTTWNATNGYTYHYGYSTGIHLGVPNADVIDTSDWHYRGNYSCTGSNPGTAYYNPTVPGNAYYNPVSPGYAYYNPTVPGNAYYNPTVPGNAGTPTNIGGVYFPAGAADSLAPVVSQTITVNQYSSSGINITVPPGGYVTIDNI